MKKIFVITTMFLFLLISSLNLWAAPKFSVEKDTFEFDSVPEGTVIKHSFIVKNTGDEPLIITKIHTG